MIMRGTGLLVLADGKRGDVPVTAGAYAQALVGETPGPFGPTPGLGVDAFTANPLLGRDALEPLVSAAVRKGLLLRTRADVEPGGGRAPGRGDPVAVDRLASLVDELGAEHLGDCGLSAVGAVGGATRPDHLERLRGLMPRAVFLLPGVGAQGGRVEDLRAAFRPHPAAGLMTASRSIVNAYVDRGGDRPTPPRPRPRNCARRPGRVVDG